MQYVITLNIAGITAWSLLKKLIFNGSVLDGKYEQDLKKNQH